MVPIILWLYVYAFQFFQHYYCYKNLDDGEILRNTLK